MASSHNLAGNYWGYLINANKSATPLLTDLCLGLAIIIAQLEPPNAGPEKTLTPQRLAAFYKSVGGNYDTLLLTTSEKNLSFIYTTLGCFHTLQPGPSAFATPSLPALTPIGYARWQTIQILLSPGDHVPFLQNAVRKYDVPRPDGGVFPKHIPTEAFPDRPDVDMDKWHREVTGRIHQENDVRRLKNSPYPSPYNPPERSDGYFSSNGKLPPQTRRPSRPLRTTSHEHELARRRSSVPELPSPQIANGESSHCASDPHGRFPDSKKRTSRSHSAHRLSSSASQNRPLTSSSQQRYSNSTHRPSGSSSYYPQNNNLAPDTQRPQPPPSLWHQRQKSSGHRARSPSTINESSGSEASSENSQSGGHASRRKSKEGRGSLWVPSFFSSSKRRHSHDASYGPEELPPKLPPRPNAYPQGKRNGDGRQESLERSDHQAQPYSVPSGARLNGGGPENDVPFRYDIFNGGRSRATSSVPEPSAQPSYIGQARPSTSQVRYVDLPPQNSHQLMDVGAPLSRERSESSGNSTDRTSRRTSTMPLRVSTVATGVGGRRYPNPETRSALERRSVAPMPV